MVSAHCSTRRTLHIAYSSGKDDVASSGGKIRASQNSAFAEKDDFFVVARQLLEWSRALKDTCLFLSAG